MSSDPHEGAVSFGLGGALRLGPGQKLTINDLIFERVPVPDGHGADDNETDAGDAFTLRAFPDPSAFIEGDDVGSVAYNQLADALRFRWVEVSPSLRGRGIEALLIRRLGELHPGMRLEADGVTTDGQALIDSLPFEATDRSCWPGR